MARARNIKPSFFTNLELGDCDPLARLLFIGLWTLSDREGRLEDKPRQIKIQTIPYDNADCDALLKQLHDNGFICRYTVEEKSYIQITNFSKHQNPHLKEKESDIPPPFKKSQSIEPVEEKKAPNLSGANQVQEPEKPQTIPADSLLLNPDSLILNPEESAQIENDSLEPKKSDRGTRLPDDFVMPNNWINIGKELRPELPEQEINLARDKFIDYWHAATGAKATKRDWLATWRNWIRSHNPRNNIHKFPDRKQSMQSDVGKA